jgi:hypothetical protein
MPLRRPALGSKLITPFAVHNSHSYGVALQQALLEVAGHLHQQVC